jgi:type I restriction enzyme M protein
MAGKYSFNPGGYFDVSIEYIEISPDEFAEKMNESKTKLKTMFADSSNLEDEILNAFARVLYAEN